MRKVRIFKFILTIILVIIQLISILMTGYSLILYNGIETFYRVYLIIIIAYLFLFITYLMLNSITDKKKFKFWIYSFLSIMISLSLYIGYYYLTNIYRSINAYSDKSNTYYSSLVSFDKKYKTFKDLNGVKIGIVRDKNDISGYIVPNSVIKELKLNTKNTIKEYDSTMDLLYSLKNNEIQAAFFSSNYIEMFSSIEGFENIENESVVLYTKEMNYTSNEEDIKSETSALNKPFTMLLIGVDSSSDGVTSGYNADVLMLATFNPKTLKATLTSIPRDTYIKTACSGNNYRRINTTTWGSSSTCAVKTVEDLFDVDIDYYAKINFKGIVKLVDSLNGIDVDVPYDFCEQNSSRKWGKYTVFVNSGKQNLNGEQALAIARNRHKPNDGSKAGAYMQRYCPTYNLGTRNDFTRGKNQIKVIKGIVNSAVKLKNPNQALEVLNVIDSNFQTNITTNDVLSLYNLGKSLLLSSNSDLINISRMQLKTYSAWGKIYDNGYNAYEIPYPGSIDDIKQAININLGKSKPTLIKNISFDLNNLYTDNVIGQGKYTEPNLNTLKDVSTLSFDELVKYAHDNKLNLIFIDVDTNNIVDINDYSIYRFYSQKEHKDRLIDTIDTLTIKVKKY